MSDTYGSGLSFSSGEGAGDARTNYSPVDPSDAVGAKPEPTNSDGLAPQQLDPVPAMKQTFGSGLRSILPGPNYTPPNPEESFLDQTAGTLQQRIKRANEVATNPVAQILNPAQVQAARTFVPQATEMLLKIEQQKSSIKAGRTQAETLGLAPGEVSDMATMEDRVTVAQSKALKGDMRAYQGLQAVSPERAAAIAPMVYETVAGNLDKAQYAFDSLAGMQNEGQYQAKLNQLRRDGALADLESLGLKVPTSFDAFQGTKAKESRALREARIGINTIGQKLEERNTYQPMEEKEAKTYSGRLTTAYGDQIANGTWGRNGASGTRGMIINGGADPNDLGKKFTLATPEQRKAIKEEFDHAVPKGEMDKYREFNRTYKLATEDAKGNKFPDGRINTNPNVQQGIAEGLAAMLRGGHGGANVGLLQIETSKRGFVQGLLDSIKTNYSGAINTLSEKDVKSYLTNLTQSQMRDVMEVLKGFNDSTIKDRASHIAQRAGALGLDAAVFGLGKSEASGAITEGLEAGRQEQIARMKPNWQAIGSGDGVMQLGAQRPGADAAGLPAGTSNTTQLPGAQPLLTPVQQSRTGGVPPAASGGPQHPAPSGVNPPAPGGAGTPPQPVRIAGVDVAVPLPQGASPDYVAKTQRIESGGTKYPWTAGTKLSSASGAFQFINRTWNENKPAGAPDRARDATPEQQAEAFSNLTRKNANVLQRFSIPVNDLNLYVAHNLGAGDGPALLNADPDQDARSVVGKQAADNNPKFFKGKPTVATVLQRYADAMEEPPDDSGPKPRTPSAGAVAARAVVGSMPGGGAATAIWDVLTPSQKDKAKELGVDLLPAAGGTAGALGGGLAGGPVGGVAGGAAGSAAGQVLKDYLKGNAQSPSEIAKQAALGGVLSVAAPARPVLSAAARVVGAGGVEGGAKALEGGDAAEVTDAALTGGALAAGGEAFGRALGMAGHKVYSMFAPDARKAVQTAAKDFSEANKVLETQPPKITSPTGSVTNPEYMAAEVKKTKAEAVLKDAGLNPDEAAYAHKVSAEGVPKAEAQAARPVVKEQQEIGRGYQQIETEVGSKGVGAVKAAPKLPDGPIAAVQNKKVSARHEELAEMVEAAITAPAPNWQAKWNQLKEARSDLLQAERDALSSTATGRSKTAEDMRTLADTVRKQQEKAAEYVFGKVEGQKVMERLKTLDVRYRNLMEATGGGSVDDLVKAAATKGEKGRELDRKFRAFAAGDPVALRAWADMRKAKGNVFEESVPWTVAGEGIPVVGRVIKVAKLATMFKEWSREKAAGSPAKFADFIKMEGGSSRPVRDVAGSVGARTAMEVAQ